MKIIGVLGIGRLSLGVGAASNFDKYVLELRPTIQSDNWHEVVLKLGAELIPTLETNLLPIVLKTRPKRWPSLATLGAGLHRV